MKLRPPASILAAALVASLAACSKSPPPAPSPEPAATQPAAAASSGEGRDGRGRRHRGDGEPGRRGDGDGDGRRGGRGFRVWDADKFLARADTNKNGKVELTELPEKSRARMAEIDTNKDGALTKDELEAHSKKLLEQRFTRMDKNKDGAVTKDEMPERAWEHFKAADADSNGGVSLPEMIEAHKTGKLGPPRGPRPGPGAGPGPAPGADADDKEPDLDDMIKGASGE